MLLDETFDADGQPVKLLELLPDGTIERYVVNSPAAMLPAPVLLPDGSVIDEHNGQLVRLPPPA
jgi:hypothetical protein